MRRTRLRTRSSRDNTERATVPLKLLTDTGLRLTCEPIPRATANLSLNQATTRNRWDRIRKAILADYGWQCAVCGMDPNNPPRPPEPKDNPWLSASARRHFQAEYEEGELSLGQRIRLECHEVWSYDHDAFVQRLAGLVPLCMLCHQVKHWRWVERGRASVFWDNEWMLAESIGSQPHRITLEQHFMETNGCGLALMRAYVGEVSTLHLWRSRYEWTVDFARYVDLVDWDKVANLRAWNAEVEERRREGNAPFLSAHRKVPRET